MGTQVIYVDGNIQCLAWVSMMKSVLCRTRPTLIVVERILAIRVVSLVSYELQLMPYALCLQTHVAQHIQNSVTLVSYYCTKLYILCICMPHDALHPWHMCLRLWHKVVSAIAGTNYMNRYWSSSSGGPHDRPVPFCCCGAGYNIIDCTMNVGWLLYKSLLKLEWYRDDTEKTWYASVEMIRINRELVRNFFLG